MPTDCTKYEDITSLLGHIKDVISDKNTFPFMEQTLPQCYQEVEAAIQGLLNDGDIPQHG